MPTAWVYKLDGTLQCGMGSAIELGQARQELTDLIGATNILAAEKRQGLTVISMCGMPTGAANAFEVTEEGLRTLFQGFPGPSGFRLWPFGGESGDAKRLDQWVPWPWSKFTNDGQLDGAAIAHALSSLTEVGANPTTLAEVVGRPCRIIHEGDAVTFDYMPLRVNIHLSRDRRIERIWFG